jgi:hypothetical protein
MGLTYTSDTDIIQSSQNDTPSKVKLEIYNQCPSIELIYPVYASDGASCYLLPNQRADVGSMIQAGFNIDLTQNESIGIFMYKLQRKHIDQSNDNIIPSEEKATCIQFVMIWKACKSEKFHVYADPIEHDKNRVWDRDNMMKLAESYKLFDVQYSPVEHTWLIYDNIVIMTSLNVIREEEYYKLEMIISEGSIKDDTWKPRYIGLNR